MTPKRVQIHQDEWLAELAKLSVRNDKGMTCKEWADKAGLSVRMMQGKLGQAHRLGWLRRGVRTGERYDGQPFPYKVFWIERPKKG